MHTIGANDIRAGDGLTWRRQQIDCTRLQVWVRARATNSAVVVFTRRAYGPRCNVGDSSRALEASRRAVQQKSTLMKCKCGGRDPGVSRPLCSRALDMGKRCVATFRHGALNWQGAPTFTAPLFLCFHFSTVSKRETVYTRCHMKGVHIPSHLQSFAGVKF